MKDCKCENVKPNGDGTWQCMLCRRKFVPDIDFNEWWDAITKPAVEADEQLPVRDPE